MCMSRNTDKKKNGDERNTGENGWDFEISGLLST